MTTNPESARHVLVVDDEPDMVALLRSLLLRAGYSVAAALDANDAWMQVCERKPDVITLDIRMPRQSGALLYRKLKADPEFRDIPVVVVTATTVEDREMEHMVRTFLEPDHIPHPHAYVGKPINEHELLEAVSSALVLSSMHA